MKKYNGFSLIEVMVTMLIVTVGMLALGSFYLASIKSESMSQERLAAVHLAEQIIEDWQNTNTDPTPDCKVGGVAASAIGPNSTNTSVADCVPNDGIPVPFDILLTVANAQAPIPSGHALHSGTTASPEMGNLWSDATDTTTRVKIRSVKVSWTHSGQNKSVTLTHIRRRP